MTKYQHVANHVFNQPWAILPETLDIIVEVLRYRMGGGKDTPDEIAERVGDSVQPEATIIQAAANAGQPQGGNIAVLPLYGVVAQRMNVVMEMSGGTSTEMFGRQFQALVADPTISAIVIDVDSPGGSVFGVEELASMIYKARSQKRIIAVADSMAASAAYWIASAADEFWVTPGGMVGSIGVVAEHWDLSKAYEMEGIKPTLIYAGKYKVEGNDTEPLPDEARDEIQRMIDSYYDSFTKAVAKNRGVSVAKVKGADFGQGRVYRAQEAVTRGMADKVGTLQDAIQAVGSGQRGPRSSAQLVVVDAGEHIIPPAASAIDEQAPDSQGHRRRQMEILKA